MTNRDRFIEELRTLIDKYSDDADRHVLAATSVLSSLAGALCEGTTEQLMAETAKFSENALRRLRAVHN